MKTLRHNLVSFLLLLPFGFFATQSFAIPQIAFESLPVGHNSNHVSHHTSGGPVLADDFASILSGPVVQVDWWGSRAASSQWEITFHPDAGRPQQEPAPVVLSQHFAGATGTDPDFDGVFFYSAAWNPQDMLVTAGTDFWFSVANFADGWTWANGMTPTVGSEQYRAVESSGAAGSPHFGPWSGICGCEDDFAFRIWVDHEDVPEPNVMALMGIGLLGLYGIRRRRGKFVAK